MIRVIRYGLMFVGGSMLVSAVVNIIAAVKLIDPYAEESIGVTRGQVIGWYIFPAIFGIALIAFGFFWRRKGLTPNRR
jgi:hypothetical protein